MMAWFIKQLQESRLPDWEAERSASSPDAQ